MIERAEQPTFEELCEHVSKRDKQVSELNARLLRPEEFRSNFLSNGLNKIANLLTTIL